MSNPLKQLTTFLMAILAALICATTGAYILWQFHTTAGLIMGVALVLLVVAIALPIPFHTGILTLKENAVTVIPVVVGAIRGGKRATDPPADGSGVSVPTAMLPEIPVSPIEEAGE